MIGADLIAYFLLVLSLKVQDEHLVSLEKGIENFLESNGFTNIYLVNISWAYFREYLHRSATIYKRAYVYTRTPCGSFRVLF